ncbi:MAG: crossover junction endodeoxyribonuclease RuvC, partial [Victivallales bacterium]|nr:crossover junction endodeoxyribonuclease RuvC [Victivallales bacterium]
MIILGIDTAIRCTGYGVVKVLSPDDFVVLDCGVIKTPQKALHSECLRRIAGGIRELVSAFKPDGAAIESAFYQKNVKTAMILSLARGAAIAVLAENGVPAREYAPRKAKKAVVGTGMASKTQVATMIASITGITLDKMPLDATDALAIAICHGQM